MSFNPETATHPITRTLVTDQPYDLQDIDHDAIINQISTNMQAIDQNAADITAANADITTANANIQKNAQDIETANTAIQKNASDIETANTAIQKNAQDIASVQATAEAKLSQIPIPTGILFRGSDHGALNNYTLQQDAYIIYYREIYTTTQEDVLPLTVDGVDLASYFVAQVSEGNFHIVSMYSGYLRAGQTIKADSSRYTLYTTA